MSTPSSTQRRSPRIPHRMPIRIGGRPDGSPLWAHTRNLGMGGLCVDAMADFNVGDALVCDLTLQGRQRALCGRVAWTEPGDSDPGGTMGIAFDGLEGHDAAVLRNILDVGTGEGRAVQLKFDGMAEPVRARARSGPHGIQLSAKLPILNRNAPVLFRFGDGTPFSGHVSHVGISEQNSERHLEVEVQVHPRERTRYRRHTQYGYAPASGSGAPLARKATVPMWTGTELAQGSDEAVALEPEQPSLEPLQTWRRRTPARLAQWLLAASLGMAAGWLLHPAPAAPATTVRTPDADPVSGGAAGRGQVPATEPATIEGRSATVPVPVEALSDTATAGAAQASDGAKLDINVAELEAAPEVPTAEQLDALRPHAPQARAKADGSEVGLPLEGDLTGMHSVRWASPRALAIDLPHASTPLADGRYALHTGSLKRLRVRQRDTGLHLVLYLSEPTGSHTLRLSQGTLRIQVAPREVPAPAVRATTRQ